MNGFGYGLPHVFGPLRFEYRGNDPGRDESGGRISERTLRRQWQSVCNHGRFLKRGRQLYYCDAECYGECPDLSNHDAAARRLTEVQGKRICCLDESLRGMSQRLLQIELSP